MAGRRGRPPHPDILTPREWDVLALLRDGLTNEQIASRLDVSPATAKYHVSEILSKLGVASREDADAWQQAEPAPRWSRLRVLMAVSGTAVVLAVLAGVGLLAWGVLRTMTKSVIECRETSWRYQLLRSFAIGATVLVMSAVGGSQMSRVLDQPSRVPVSAETSSTVMWGDVDCSGAVDTVDALTTLRYVAALTVSLRQPCPEVNSDVVADGANAAWGDVNCLGGVDSVDSLLLLRFIAGLSNEEGATCPETGTAITVIVDALRLSGSVIDQRGDPIAGAIVTIERTRASGKTDNEGRFLIQLGSGREGEFTLHVEKSGYSTMEEQLVARPDDPELGVSRVELVRKGAKVEIGELGGLVPVEGGGNVLVPPGALSGPVKISATRLSASQMPAVPHGSAVTENFVAVGGILLEPSGLSFERPVTVELPIGHLVDVQLFDFSEPSSFRAGQYDFDTNSYPPDGPPASNDNEKALVSFQLDHFSEIQMYDDFGIADYVAHWIDITDPVRRLEDHTTILNCEEIHPKAPTVVITDTEALTRTQGKEESVGLTGKLTWEGIGELAATLGLKFNSSITESSQQSVGRIFPGAEYSAPVQGPAKTRIHWKEITATFYKKIVGSSETVEFQFTERYDFFSENIPPIPCPSRTPTPTPKPTLTPTTRPSRTPTPSPTPAATPSPTQTATEPPTPTPTPTPTPSPTPTATPSPTQTATEPPTPPPTPAPMPTHAYALTINAKGDVTLGRAERQRMG